jgi:hypothetical protein
VSARRVLTRAMRFFTGALSAITGATLFVVGGCASSSCTTLIAMDLTHLGSMTGVRALVAGAGGQLSQG